MLITCEFSQRDQILTRCHSSITINGGKLQLMLNMAVFWGGLWATLLACYCACSCFCNSKFKKPSVASLLRLWLFFIAPLLKLLLKGQDATVYTLILQHGVRICVKRMWMCNYKNVLAWQLTRHVTLYYLIWLKTSFVYFSSCTWVCLWAPVEMSLNRAIWSPSSLSTSCSKALGPRSPMWTIWSSSEIFTRYLMPLAKIIHTSFNSHLSLALFPDWLIMRWNISFTGERNSCGRWSDTTLNKWVIQIHFHTNSEFIAWPNIYIYCVFAYS